MNTPHLFLVGATHRTAPFGFRERLALGADGEAGLATELSGLRGLREFVILNTCNRVEIYGVAAEEAIADRVSGAYCRRQGVQAGEFAQFGLCLRDADVVGHLLEVTAGLDSQVIGENEIFGQAKRAYAGAQERGSAGPLLNRLFQKAFQAAKHVRSSTAITAGQVSVANVAVDLAQSIFGSLADTRVVLIGAGEMGEKSGRAFRSRGAGHLTVLSRRLERARSLAAELGAEALEFTEREARLAAADIVVCSTSAPAAVVSLAAVNSALAGRGARPLLLIDLGMPRNIEPGVAGRGKVYLYNLDDLARVAEKNRQARELEAQRCRGLLADRCQALWRQLEGQMKTGQRRSEGAPAACPAGLGLPAAA